METQDRIFGLESALSPQSRKRSDENPDGVNIGGLVIKRHDGRDGYGAEVASILAARNGTVEWNREDPINGIASFDNIYQYIAAEIHAPAGTLRERINVSGEREHEARSGVTTLAKWLDDQFGMPLFRCVTPNSGNKVVTVTVQPDYVVNPDTGETAMQSQINRDRKAVAGQIEASFLRLGRAKGPEYAKQVLLEAANTTLGKALPVPKRS